MPNRIKLFRVEVTIAATAYVKARSVPEAEALIAKMLKDAVLEVENMSDDSEVEISGLAYDHPDLPPVSLSPAMTIRNWGPVEKAD